VPKLAAAARFVLAEFGPLIVFWALALAFGIKPAIAGSLAAILADAAWRGRSSKSMRRTAPIRAA